MVYTEKSFKIKTFGESINYNGRKNPHVGIRCLFLDIIMAKYNFRIGTLWY
jgi:hypothetical protein